MIFKSNSERAGQFNVSDANEVFYLKTPKYPIIQLEIGRLTIIELRK